MLSDTPVLLACADEAHLMQKENWRDSNATLEAEDGNKPDQRLYLSNGPESLVWSLDHTENALWKPPPAPAPEAVAKIVSTENYE